MSLSLLVVYIVYTYLLIEDEENEVKGSLKKALRDATDDDVTHR